MPYKHVLVALALSVLTSVSWMFLQSHIPPNFAGLEFAAPDPSPHPSLEAAYSKLPLSFEVNQGQTDDPVRFLSRRHGYALFLTPTAAVLTRSRSRAAKESRMAAKTETETDDTDLARKAAIEFTPAPAVLRMKLVGAGSSTELRGLDELPGKVNYFTGSNPRDWRTNISTYARVKYEDAYPGVDLIYYGKEGELEYDFVVAPGADPNVINLAFEGADKLEVDAEGNLIVHTGPDQLIQRVPKIYQEIGGFKQPIAGGYIVKTAENPKSATANPQSVVGFRLGAYDATKQLVIDPVLAYSTYLGGTQRENVASIAVDAGGNIYLTGIAGANFPTTVNSLQPAFGGPPGGPNDAGDAYVTKLNAEGSALVYSTYLGGSGQELAGGIAVDASGSAYIMGSTDSTNFPTVNALQPAYGGSNDVFVAKLNANGSALIYSTYLGGSGQEGAIARFGEIGVDAAGNAYVIGPTSSTDFPTTPGAFQKNFGGGVQAQMGDAFVAKITADGRALAYSTYLGGSGDERALDIDVDAGGNAYATGFTRSQNFPTRNALQSALAGTQDIFVTKFSPQGSLVYSTYFGGSGIESTEGAGIAVDSAGSVYLAGGTSSTDFPTYNPLQAAYGGGELDAFVAKLSPDGRSLVYSTYLGGTGIDGGNRIAVDSAGNAYVTGNVQSTDFPTVNAIQPTYAGGIDIYLAKLSPDGRTLIYSTYLGGSGQDQIPAGVAIDGSGNAYIAGFTGSTDFPTANPLQPNFAGGLRDGWVAKISEMTRPYSITDRGGVSFSGHGTSALSAGYARIQPNTGSTTPSGVAILGFRQNDVLVSEAGVQASTLMTSGRIHAEVGGPVNTGIAMANGSNQAVTGSFFFTNEAGQNSAQGSITIPANGQIARFLNEAPFNAGTSFRGTLTFNVIAPVGVIALRGFTNERSEFLITNVPTVDLSAAASETPVIPSFADGGGWTTTIVLVNSTDGLESGSIQFLGNGSANVAAEPVSVTVGNQQNSTFSYNVPPRASVRFQTGGSTLAIRAGSVRVSPAPFSNRIPSAFAISSFRNAGVTISEVSVQAARPGSAFRMYAEASGNFGQSAVGSIQTGIAIASTSSVSAPVSFELTSLSGASTGLNGSVTVPPQGQVAIFLNQIPGFQSLPLPFQGILRISTTLSSGISIVGIRGRYNERRDFLMTAIPPVSEASAASSAETIFPQWTIGGGYSTQFILFGLPGPTSAGVLRFFSQTGQPLI